MEQQKNGNGARDFTGVEIVNRVGETAAAAVAEKARAMVNARYIMAMQRPRDLDLVRVKLLRACQRVTFAKIARYKKPIGKGVVGWTIRFVEEAIRTLTNISIDVEVVFDDLAQRHLMITVVDLESNVPYSQTIVVEKSVERTDRTGRDVISQRQNSQGKTTYLVAATEDELRMKQGAEISKAIRTEGLRLIPGDILDECLQHIQKALTANFAGDPDAARKEACDAFAELGVMPPDLKAYVGFDLGQMRAEHVRELVELHSAIKNGEVTWVEALEDRFAERRAEQANTTKPPPVPTSKVEATIAEVTRPMTQPAQATTQAVLEQKPAPARQRRARTPVNPSTPTGPVEPDPHGTMPDAAIPPAASEPPKTETQGLADQGVVDEPPDDYSAVPEAKPNTLLDVASDGFARPSKVDSLAMKIAQARTADVLEDLAIEVSGADAINEITRDQAIQLTQMIADRKAEDPEIVLDRIQRALDEETLGRIKASVTPRLKFFTAEHLKAFSAAQAKRRAEIKAGRVSGAHRADGDR